MRKNSQQFVNLGQGLSIMVGFPTISSWTSESRPQNAKRGTFGFNESTNSLEYWDGENWFEARMTGS